VSGKIVYLTKLNFILKVQVMSFRETLHRETSRWLMRYTQAGVPLKQLAWTITAGSTLITALTSIGVGFNALVVVGIYIGFQILFMWAYDRFKILNRQMKIDADRSSNFMPPKWCMDNLIRSKQFAIMTQGINEEWDREKIDQKMLEETKHLIEHYRDGIDTDDIEKGEN
jgi:hypothetical protein